MRDRKKWGALVNPMRSRPAITHKKNQHERKTWWIRRKYISVVFERIYAIFPLYFIFFFSFRQVSSVLMQTHTHTRTNSAEKKMQLEFIRERIKKSNEIAFGKRTHWIKYTRHTSQDEICRNWWWLLYRASWWCVDACIGHTQYMLCALIFDRNYFYFCLFDCVIWRVKQKKKIEYEIRGIQNHSHSFRILLTATLE